MKALPDFYLSCDDLNSSFETRSCSIGQRIIAPKRDDFLVVKISPPLPGFYGDPDIEEVVLASCYEGNSLFPINEWPMHVYVCKILNVHIKEIGQAYPEDLSIILKGILHRTSEEAKNFAKYTII